MAPGHVITYSRACLADFLFPIRKQASAIAANIQVDASQSFLGSGINFQALLYSDIASSYRFWVANSSPFLQSRVIYS